MNKKNLFENRVITITPANGAVTMKSILTKWITVAAVTATLGFAASIQAAVVTTQTGQNAAFAASGTDLLQTSLDTINNSLTVNGGENGSAGGATESIWRDGSTGLGSPGDGRVGGHVITAGTITYNLDTSVNTLGYDITSIETFAGWSDNNRGSQQYTVSFSVVGSAGFTDAATVTIATDGFQQERWVITEGATGILGSGVDAVRFTFPTQQFSGVGYKELDVFGSATVPEPSTLALLGAGLGVILAARRRVRAA